MREMRRWILSFLALFPMALAGGLGVTPPYIELSLAPGEVAEKSIVAFAVDANFDQVETRVVDFAVAKNGAVVVLTPGELPHSAARWIEIKTPPFALANQQRATIEFAVRVPPQIEGGSYTAGILVEPTSGPVSAPEEGKRVVIQGRMLVPVLVKIPGTLHPGYRLVETRREEGRLVLVFQNTGNVYLSLDGRVRLLSPEGEAVEELKAPHVFLDRGSTVEVAIPLPRDPKGAVLLTVEYWVNGYNLPRAYAEEVLAEP